MCVRLRDNARCTSTKTLPCGRSYRSVFVVLSIIPRGVALVNFTRFFFLLLFSSLFSITSSRCYSAVIAPRAISIFTENPDEFLRIPRRPKSSSNNPAAATVFGGASRESPFVHRSVSVTDHGCSSEQPKTNAERVLLNVSVTVGSIGSSPAASGSVTRGTFFFCPVPLKYGLVEFPSSNRNGRTLFRFQTHSSYDTSILND